MGSQLIFSDRGDSVFIKFANGSESLDFESKEEAIHAVSHCQILGKITKDEARQFLKEISLAENMPNHNKVLSLFPLIILSLLLNSRIEQEQEEIFEPYVEICDCGHKTAHAYIYNGNKKVIGPTFQFKSEGFDIVQNLLTSGYIDEGDSARLNTLIDLLKLPESPILN
jgi:hypothetical protein